MPQDKPGNVGDTIGGAVGGIIEDIGDALSGGGGGGGGGNDGLYDGSGGGGGTSSGGGTSGGGGTSSGGSSGGGSGGTSDAEAKAKANNKAFFLNTLQELGIKLTPNLQQLVNNAIAKDYNAANFMNYLRKTKEYHERFTGIFNKNGTLKMSEAQYLSNVNRYQDVASKAGINLGGKTIDWLFKNNVSVSEFSDRATAVTRLKRNPDLYAAFKRELIQAGEKPNQITQKGLLKFILGEGNGKWYDLWQDAVTRNAATQAGLAIGKRNALEQLPQGIVERISGLGLSESALNKGFEQLADDFANLLPDSRFYGSGITKSDLVTLRFGGKGRQEIKDKVAAVIAQKNLAQEDKANAQLVQTAPGKSSLMYGGLSGDAGE
jgi:hypothetical protein